MSPFGSLAPTPRLRWVKRDRRSPAEIESHDRDGVTSFQVPVLQQWWAPDMPGYMRSEVDGEWRDVEVVEELVPP